MDDIANIKTDATIANILQKLKETKPKEALSTSKVQDKKDADKPPSLMVPVSEINVSNIPKKEVIKEEPKTTNVLKEDSITNKTILPWFNAKDLDLKLIHCITLNDVGNLEYNTIKADRPANDIASLKMRDKYMCDIDYYKSNHYVLYVKNFDSNYPSSRTYTPSKNSDMPINESADDLEMQRLSGDDFSLQVASSDKYYRFVVFTDLGTASFLVRQDDLSYPFGEANLNKWFEEMSNYTPIQEPTYEPNDLSLPEEISNIRDFRYDIITMHRPGIITLDSSDNDDNDYKVTIKLKDDYWFIPLKRILGCIKFYSTHKEKSLTDFKQFINKYFDLI